MNLHLQHQVIIQQLLYQINVFFIVILDILGTEVVVINQQVLDEVDEVDEVEVDDEVHFQQQLPAVIHY